jgi:rubrerythrin
MKMREARRAIGKLKAKGGIEVVGCSLCARLTAKGDKPKPCPVCGAPVQPAPKAGAR